MAKCVIVGTWSQILQILQEEWNLLMRNYEKIYTAKGMMHSDGDDNENYLLLLRPLLMNLLTHICLQFCCTCSTPTPPSTDTCLWFYFYISCEAYTCHNHAANFQNMICFTLFGLICWSWSLVIRIRTFFVLGLHALASNMLHGGLCSWHEIGILSEYILHACESRWIY